MTLSDPTTTLHRLPTVDEASKRDARHRTRGGKRGPRPTSSSLSPSFLNGQSSEVNEADISYSMGHFSLTEPAPASIFLRHGFVRAPGPVRQWQGGWRIVVEPAVQEPADCAGGMVKECPLLLCRLSDPCGRFPGVGSNGSKWEVGWCVSARFQAGPVW